MKLPHDLSAQEIRVLQEFRRLEKGALSKEEIAAVKHPAPPMTDVASALVEKGWVQTNGTGGTYELTEKAKEFLSFNPVPLYEREG